MMKRRLGRSNIEVCALGFGCMEIGGRMKDHERPPVKGSTHDTDQYFFLGEVNDQESIRAIHAALDRGISLFDTAPAYGAGHSERVLGKALSEKRQEAVIATKFGKFIDEQQNIFGRYPNERVLVDNIRSECEDSLVRLRTDYIDIYQFHQEGDYTLLAYADEVIDILESLVSEGKIRFYGWSTGDPACARVFARGTHCTAIQHSLSLLKDAPELLEICTTYDQGSISRGVLAMGILSGKYTRENYKTLLAPDDYRLRDSAGTRLLHNLEQLDKIKHVLTSDGRTIPQGALAWNWARSDRTIPIVGFRRLSQIPENSKALEYGPLNNDQMNEIDKILERKIR